MPFGVRSESVLTTRTAMLQSPEAMHTCHYAAVGEHRHVVGRQQQAAPYGQRCAVGGSARQRSCVADQVAGLSRAGAEREDGGSDHAHAAAAQLACGRTWGAVHIEYAVSKAHQEAVKQLHLTSSRFMHSCMHV